jgi:hypothetical protein
MPGNAGYKELGDHFYLFTTSHGEKSGATCVISGHGAQPLFNSTFKVPDKMTIKFYVAEGERLDSFISFNKDGTHSDPALTKISKELVGPVDTVTNQGICKNYTLGKFQSSSPTGLTKGWLTNRWDDRSAVTYDDILTYLNANTCNPDILTVRHRVWHANPTLSDAIAALHSLQYQEVRCYFCRTPSVMPEKGTVEFRF